MRPEKCNNIERQLKNVYVLRGNNAYPRNTQLGHSMSAHVCAENTHFSQIRQNWSSGQKGKFWPKLSPKFEFDLIFFLIWPSQSFNPHPS